MYMIGIPLKTTDWSTMARTEHVPGKAYWRTREFDGIRVRIVVEPHRSYAEVGATLFVVE